MQIIKYSKIYLTIAALTTLVGLIAIFTFKLPLGIDFTGGTMVEIKTSQEKSSTQIRGEISEFYKNNLTIQNSGENQFIIKTSPLEESQFKELEENLKNKLSADILRHQQIGGSIGSATTTNAIYAIILSAIFIVIYLSWAFRKVPRSVSPWAFGIIAFVALIHDLSFSFGLFALIGKYSGFELDSSILVAALTILGFSVHDTIVVFDRLRENIIRFPQKSIEENTQSSLMETLARSLNTSLTALLVLVSMIILGGESIKPFILFLAIGIAIGTYSSIFIASPTLVLYQNYKERKKD
ncbi:MAG: preprotein translocase subunit SecF [candidate division WS2 bacterium ADurb.Bin280]|uniref:Protein-export membrane protein SecF n=1 Tax=candidate division WS2 bacterium ADurb.Bin280 TaxID=1852829 RepID=A0A1V5SG68_9BACT|nr:MAG: preprotein translocase subunit SecF [candidate division WS2 bacterium ADurb.Bin280]